MTNTDRENVMRCSRWHKNKASELEGIIDDLDKITDPYDLGSIWTLGKKRKSMQREVREHRRFSNILFSVSVG